jgi:hypothetical protein
MPKLNAYPQIIIATTYRVFVTMFLPLQRLKAGYSCFLCPWTTADHSQPYALGWTHMSRQEINPKWDM